MASMLESKVEERKLDKPVDREKTCPLLLRVFLSSGRHSNINEYRRGNVPANELQIYTWMDATLNEICSLVQEVNSDAKRRGTVFEFSLVVPELSKPLPRMRDLGTIVVGQKGFDDNKTLSQCGSMYWAEIHGFDASTAILSQMPKEKKIPSDDYAYHSPRAWTDTGFTIGDFLDIAIISPQRPAQRRMRPYYSEAKNF